MKTTQAVLAVGLGLILIALLTFGVLKAAKELSGVIAVGIGNMYSSQAD